MRAVVSDTSVLNYLGRLGHFHLLRLEFQAVLVPSAVLAELRMRPELPGVHCVQQAQAEGWIETRSPHDQGLVQSLRVTLGAGEAEAIALAQELPVALLLMDDAEARAVAETRKIPLIGTAGILLRARKSGAITRMKPLLDELIQQHGFRLSRKIYNDALREVGEVP
jgi:predicted nucleic acid-binding protein